MNGLHKDRARFLLLEHQQAVLTEGLVHLCVGIEELGSFLEVGCALVELKTSQESGNRRSSFTNNFGAVEMQAQIHQFL